LPILLPVNSVNQRFPEASDARLAGWLLAVGTLHSVMATWAPALAAMIAATAAIASSPSR
jgi:hypothetical protein